MVSLRLMIFIGIVVAGFCVQTALPLFLKNTVCYKELGCFSIKGAFSGFPRIISVTPSSPDSIRTNFILYTKENPNEGKALDARKTATVQSQWSHFKNRHTRFIIHGFLDDTRFVSWIKEMKDQLLKHGDDNVIVVSWHHGNLPPYTQATANTRVVGAQIALLIKKLQKHFKVKPGQFHIIGHSLGAHVAGYAGERVPGLGRITGLDPAGPYFDSTEKEVRLDPTDAEFVDVIHSDGKDILKLGLGLLQPLGHFDFYPNMGHDQPGCSKAHVLKNFWKHGFVQGIRETFACSHLRSIKYFTESINSKCPFMAFPCNSEEDFKANKCHKCPAGGCPTMGFKADQYKKTSKLFAKYFTSTTSSSPYCHFQVNIRVSISIQSKQERGRVEVRLHGNKGSSGWLAIDTSARQYIPGTTYERTVGVPADVGTLRAVDFRWHHSSSITNPLKWNWFGLRHPKLRLHRIHVVREGLGKSVRFCAKDVDVDNHKTLYVNKKC